MIPYPRSAHLVADALEVSVGECLVAGGINFYYRRAPHLEPPHQIEGLARKFVPRVLERFGVPFERRITNAADAGLAALETAPLPAFVETNDGVRRIEAVDGEHVYVADTDGDRAVPRVAFADAWMRAVPAGVWYRVTWSDYRRHARHSHALQEGLRDTAYDMMVCSGAWQGIDGIEFLSDDLVRWPADDGWESSALDVADRIRASGSLWRRAYHEALTDVRDNADVPVAWCDQMAEIARLWHTAADGFADAGRREDADRLTSLTTQLLRLVAAESRFWDQVIKQGEPSI